MSGFERKAGTLAVDGLPLDRLASEFGTPLYVYSRKLIEQNWQAFDSALGSTPHRVCYAVKANSNLAVLGVLAQLGSSFEQNSRGNGASISGRHCLF